ncbi:MAG TPA: PRC-barrel domain-containing protein [Burkholderiales bacterium]
MGLRGHAAMTMRVFMLCLALLASAEVRAAAAAALLGEPVRNLQGKRVGTVEDLIIDARAGRVLYVIVEGDGRYFTLPVRALHERPRLVDMSLAGAAAYDRWPAKERFRRAARLLGEEVRRAGEERIGVIHDIRYDADSGRVQEVLVRSAERGELSLPPEVLAYGFLPPLTRPRPADPPRYSSERNLLHDHDWK